MALSIVLFGLLSLSLFYCMGKRLKEIGHLLAHLLLNGGKVNILEL